MIVQHSSIQFIRFPHQEVTLAVGTLGCSQVFAQELYVLTSQQPDTSTVMIIYTTFFIVFEKIRK